jgi:hypothetical protein
MIDFDALAERALCSVEEGGDIPEAFSQRARKRR